MEKPTLDQRLKLDYQLPQEPKKIESICLLNPDTNISEILTKLDSSEHIHVYLREKGIEICGEFSCGERGGCGNKSIGAIVSGSNLRKEFYNLYLVTFDYQEGEKSLLTPKFNLAEILRDYIEL